MAEKSRNNMSEKPLVNREYLLEKFPGKSGWTYTIIPEILPDKKSHFGWVKVKGTIDGYEISNYHLMPTVKGTGKLFLSVKAEIRKKIKKEAGDYVHLILYADNDPFEIPAELWLCLQDTPEALTFFNSLNENEQQKYVKWIYAAKTDKTKVDRIAKTIAGLSKQQKFANLQ